MKLGLMITGIALSLTTTGVTAFAQTPAKKVVSSSNPIVEVREEKNVTCDYVDADQDGICDNQGTGNGHQQAHGGYVDADHDGICDNQGSGNGSQQAHGGYVDADQDGICDNQGTGNGNQQAHNGYVDTDQDGICDNQGTGNGSQQARRGNGKHHA